MKLFGILMFFGMVLLAEPALELKFDVNHTHFKPRDDKGLKFTETKTSLQEDVFVSNDVIKFRVGASRKLVDFSRKKIYLSIPNKETYIEKSLYSDIGFRVIEFQNRQKLSGVLAGAGLKDNPMGTVFSENMFSIRSKNSIKLKPTKENGSVSFSHQGKLLFSYQPGEGVVSAGRLKQFISFLRYRFGVHPDILDYLAKGKKIPDTFKYNRYNISKDFYTYKLKSIKEINKTYDFANLSLERGNSKINNLVSRAKTLKEDLPNILSQTLGRALDCAKKGQNLTAVMLFIEYTLISGSAMPVEFQNYRAQFMNDKSVTLLFQSVGAKSKEEAEQGLKDLAKLEKQSLVDNELSKIFQFNLLNSLNRQDDAKQKVFEVLEKKPYITGLWKDLGDMYYKAFNSTSAWQCWDVARFIAPGHKMLKGITEYEKKLQIDYSEFFVSGESQ